MPATVDKPRVPIELEERIAAEREMLRLAQQLTADNGISLETALERMQAVADGPPEAQPPRRPESVSGANRHERRRSAAFARRQR